MKIATMKMNLRKMYAFVPSLPFASSLTDCRTIMPNQSRRLRSVSRAECAICTVPNSYFGLLLILQSSVFIYHHASSTDWWMRFTLSYSTGYFRSRACIGVFCMHDNSCLSSFLEYNNLLLSFVCSCFKLQEIRRKKSRYKVVHEAQIDAKAICDNAPEKQDFQ